MGQKKISYEIVMPQLSDSMDEGKLISWKVKEGQKVKVGDVIAEVESDKAIMEVQSFQKGVVTEIRAKEGDVIPVGEVIAIIEANESESPVKKREKAPVQKPQLESAVTKETKPKITLPKYRAHDETGGISPKSKSQSSTVWS